MKKTVEVEMTICDFCGENDCHRKCRGCGKDICFECMNTNAKRYNSLVYAMTSDDGIYCHECDIEKLEDGDKLHAAYRKIESLKNEASGFNIDFKKRSDKAEAELKSLLNYLK